MTRAGIDEIIPHGGHGIPWTIIGINLLGSAALGALTGWTERLGARPWLPFVGPGVLGGFTTFSALAAASWAHSGASVTGIVVLVLTTIGTVLLAGLAWSVASRREEST